MGVDERIPTGDYELINFGVKNIDWLFVDINFRAQFDIAQPTQLLAIVN